MNILTVSDQHVLDNPCIYISLNVQPICPEEGGVTKIFSHEKVGGDENSHSHERSRDDDASHPYDLLLAHFGLQE